MPPNYRFGGGVASTTLNPVVLVAMLIAIGLILFLPRKRVVVPFLLITLSVPIGQTVVLGGAHFFVYRIVIISALVRLFIEKHRAKSPILPGGLHAIDKAVTLWAVSHSIAFIILYRQGPAIINQFGYLLDTLGGYFSVRFMIQEEREIRTAAKALCLVAILAALSMVSEQLVQKNLFGFFGGQIIPDIRNGRIRSQGPFAHAILAGVYGATVFPLFLWLWKYAEERALTTLGVIAAGAMVITSSSSTPLIAWPAGIFGLGLWKLRNKMRTIRLAAVICVLLLALAMKAPVWFLIARIDIVGGSSGYHRALLIDRFVRRWREWWLLGTSENQNWGLDLWDLQNQFVMEGLTGGIVPFYFFVSAISRSFMALGRARRTVERDGAREWLLWTLGAVLFAHCVAFFGCNYFDQTKIWLLTSLAMIIAATAPVGGKGRSPSKVKS